MDYLEIDSIIMSLRFRTKNILQAASANFN